jgi:hypothetical protein
VEEKWFLTAPETYSSVAELYAQATWKAAPARVEVNKVDEA